MTCYLLPIAILGLVLQLYIIATGRYQHWILPFWVFCNFLWTTLTLEFWKRKTWEINFRLGIFDLKTNQLKTVRWEFSGDEIIS